MEQGAQAGATQQQPPVSTGGQQPQQPASAAPQQTGGDQPASSGGVAVPPAIIGGDAGRAPVQADVSDVSKPDLPGCPRCNIGLMYVIAWDEAGSHEFGNLVFAPKQRSGGAAIRQCLHCGHGDTVALNPSDAPADPLAGRL